MRTYPKALLLLLFLLPAAPHFAQSARAFADAGETALQSGDHYTAMVQYGRAVQRDDRPAYRLGWGEAAARFGAWNRAVEILQPLAGRDQPAALYWLGLSYQSTGRYDDAREALRQYLTRPSGGYEQEARRRLSQVNWARQQPDTIAAAVMAERMSRRVNTSYSEFAPVQHNDTLYYSSYRYEREDDDYRPNRRIAKVLIARGTGRGRPLGRSFNEDTLHTASVALSPDGRRIYFSRCGFVQGARIRCALYYRERDSRGRWERRAYRLPETINGHESTTTQPAVYFDTLLQSEVLIFVSDRPGGRGGTDLWWAVRGEEDKWEMVQPLSDLNTELDEASPHWRDGSLYFASQGLMGYGGYDIFRSQWSAGQRTTAPVNLGPPFNSSYDDLYLFQLPDTLAGYFASNRPGGAEMDRDTETCCLDLFAYHAIPPPDTTPAPPEEPVTIVPPREEVPRSLQDFLPLALYFDNDEPDRRTRRTTTRQPYGETYDKYLSRRPDYEDALTGGLDEPATEAALMALDSFFEERVIFGRQRLELFSEMLLQRLQSGDTVEIFLKGYTSPRARDDYNLALGQRRVSSVRLHFQQWRGGIFRSFLADGRLRISEKSFGETRAARVSDALEDVQGSIYSPAAAGERRVEVVEVKEKG